MKNINFPKNKNVGIYSNNIITSAPEQSPIIIPANVETPVILRGGVEIETGERFFKYTNIETGEFNLNDYGTFIGHINYVLAPESAEGSMALAVYLNGNLYIRFTYDIVHTATIHDVGTIEFNLHNHEATDILKMTVLSSAENLIFADVIGINGTVKKPALTMTLEK